jgi:hypothetical protein
MTSCNDDELIEKMARAMDFDAWDVLSNGRRDLIKYQVARSRSLRFAQAALEILKPRLSQLTEQLKEAEAELVPLRKLRDSPAWEVIRSTLSKD